MMETQCPECNALWKDGLTCQEAFHRMLFWESEQPALGVVHHLMVLCYYLQHPAGLSPDGLKQQTRLLADFVAGGVKPEQARRRGRRALDSGRRAWKITARPGQQASYPHPMRWPMTAPDVLAGGKEQYCERVRRWARLTHEAIQNG